MSQTASKASAASKMGGLFRCFGKQEKTSSAAVLVARHKAVPAAAQFTQRHKVPATFPSRAMATQNASKKSGIMACKPINFDLLCKIHALMQSSYFCILRFIAEKRGQMIWHKVNCAFS
uniref:Uncharacterized protein n=1 Tax=Romanomermis culicivorax TaxID=13658 RepID=A0A915KNX4_ROMCU